MTDYKQLCVELLSELENAIRVIHAEDGTRHISGAYPVINKVKSTLAEPEPEPLTDCPSAVLKRAREINDMMAVTVYGPHEPDECAASWVTSKMLASLEARIAVLESCSATPRSEND